MKKLFYFLFALFMFYGANAQEHLTFKGVPIDGTLKSYTDAMIRAGFHYEGTQDGISLLTGDFAGYKNCIIGVSTLKNLDLVNRIAVLFPKKETWTSVLSDYENLKSMLTKKYGEPKYSNEKFTGYIGDYDNGLVMHALSEGEYDWYTVFSTALGDIELSIIEGSSYHTACVKLTYYDDKNYKIVQDSAIDDL